MKNEETKQSTEDKKEDLKDAKIKELEGEVKELKDKLIYSMAEQQNIRRIAKEDVAKEREYGITSFAKQMLEVADNLGRCLANVPKDELKENRNLRILFEGIEMTERELMKTFSKNGVTKFDPLNEKFDPNKMNALTQIPVEGKEPGTVAMVMKTGYMLKDRVLRPADVGVVMQPEENSE